MAVSRKFQAARKILILFHIQLLCCPLFDIKLKKTTRVINWRELYVWSDLIKVKIFTSGFKRQRKFMLRPLTFANATKLILGLRLLLYALLETTQVKIYSKKVLKMCFNQREKCDKRSKSTNGETSSNLYRFQNFVYAEDFLIV